MPPPRPLCRFGRRVAARLVVSASLLVAGCGPRSTPRAEPTHPAVARPSLLLVTLDTTRADAVAPEVDSAATPALATLAARSLRFAQAYSTAPTTLPAHASMMSGLYPAGHGVHENGRRIADRVPLLAERLDELGYATAAFVSGYPLERQVGIGRGFTVYDDAFGPGRVERDAGATTDRALAWLAAAPGGPFLLWVHYYDPHDPYDPPEPFRSRFPHDLYRGEIAAMDHQLGRLLAAFEAKVGQGPWRELVLADHGEGRGDHGESLHGNLLYQGVMRVPLFVAGSGIAAGERRDPVSIRQVRPTLLSWAGEATAGDLLAPATEPALGEAMQPFLNYRWQPQTMAVFGRHKLIRSGRLELYDVVADPREAQDLAASASPDRTLARAVADYPLPTPPKPGVPEPALREEDQRRLASLGYLTSAGAPAGVPAGAPRAAEMTHLFGHLDLGSRRFANGDYAQVIPIFERILRDDPGNLMTAVRLAVAQGFAGRDAEALRTFERARRIDPESLEVRHYLAMQHLSRGRFAEAAPLFEAVLAAQPDRLPALAGLARVRLQQGRGSEAAALLERAVPLAGDPGPLLVELGEAQMSVGESAAALEAFERARAQQGAAFVHDLELGVLYLEARRLPEAREALDRVAPNHPAHALALFKRAQVAVLLDESDRAERVRAAWMASDAETRALIARERLFAGLLPN
ncbi:MAG: sulfatase-like hydrolase/transferase [Holophagales bacterium]|nr:MAG: sulfatase-like hydrolase/transferase [Holophagales bacterium]